MTTSLDRTPSAGASSPGIGLVTQLSWWRDAVIYQIYVRSFADDNGDGTGDLAGVRSRLPYLRDLGVDAIWFTPWYRSPLADGGYDVEDYRAIDPAFGTIADAELLIEEARALGIRTIVDVVPNHVSSEHDWFKRALASGPGSAERERFWFRDGRGPNGDEMPTHWVSSFSGTTWTRTTDPDGTPGQWYLHLFTPEQPDLNWGNAEVQREHEDILRFWLDRGVAGVRIDSAALVAKDPELPELPENPAAGQHPHLDRDELHDIYRGWRAVTDSYDDERVLVGEIWLADPARFALYLRPDEMHTAFNFDFMGRPWDAAQLRASITSTLGDHEIVGAPATWVLSNHDVTRPVTRYGRAESGFSFDAKRFGTATDSALGLRRARAGALLIGALPGSLYIYQGDELGLPEVEDLPLASLQDPMHFRSEGVDPGRDGCRVPLPWSSAGTSAGFSPAGATAPPWLPLPDDWATHSVERQTADPESTLSLYRSMTRLRRALRAESDTAFSWFDTENDEVIAFARGDAFLCVVNFGAASVSLPSNREVLLTSGPLEAGELPTDTAAWLRV